MCIRDSILLWYAHYKYLNDKEILLMRGRTIVEQIDHDGNTYMDVDISLSAKGLFEVLKTYFPDIRKDNGMITGKDVYKRQVKEGLCDAQPLLHPS